MPASSQVDSMHYHVHNWREESCAILHRCPCCSYDTSVYAFCDTKLRSSIYSLALYCKGYTCIVMLPFSCPKWQILSTCNSCLQDVPFLSQVQVSDLLSKLLSSGRTSTCDNEAYSRSWQPWTLMLLSRATQHVIAIQQRTS